jgi:hypothetical protein
MTALLALQAGAQTAPLPGDLNGDNEVNITDINLLINAIYTGNGEAIYDLNGDGAINITDLSTLLEIAMAVTPEPDFEIDGEHASGCWIVFVDVNGNHNWYKNEKSDHFTKNCVTLNYGDYGSFYWDPDLSPEENNLNRPNVPFCLVIDGVRYGSTISNMPPAIAHPNYHDFMKPYYKARNTLVKSNKYYTVPVGYTYYMDIVQDEETGDFYLDVATFRN